jgi:hypothetical protein
VRKPTRGGEEKGRVKPCKRRSIGEALQEEEDWKNTKWLLT